MDLKPPLQNVIDGAAHPSINNSSSSISTQTTVTPDPRWPSKCRWSSPPASTSTLSTEVGDGEDMRHQIDAVDLELSPKDSKITNQPEDDRNTCVPHSRSPQSTGLPPITTTSPEISVDSPIAAFVPSIGAWAKPLAFAPPATPPAPATPSGLDPQYLNNLLDSFWPTLAEGLGPNQKKRKNHPSAVREFPRMPVQKIPVPELKGDGTLRFPWAARMDPATRNLYRAAKPTFRLDGTPQEKRCLLPAVQLNVEKSSTHEDSSAGKTQPEMEKALAQSNGPSDQLVLQAENLESGLVSAEEGREELTEVTLDLSLGHLQPLSVELKNLSTP
ncbi:hypothetical protein HID58_041262, partial [Brassica napus]